MLEVTTLAVKYGELCALKNFNARIRKGEIYSIMGANGAGKSTLLKCIQGLLNPFSGAISFEEKNISGVSAAQRAFLGMVLVPEGRMVFAQQSVEDNLRLGCFNATSKEYKLRLQREYERFPRLLERRNQMAGLLSGGEQQMLALSRALMSNPKLLLLDEPGLGLAPRVVTEIFSHFKNLAENGMSIVLVEQNARAALRVAHSGAFLNAGEIALQGTAEFLKNSNELSKIYFGNTASK